MCQPGPTRRTRAAFSGLGRGYRRSAVAFPFLGEDVPTLASILIGMRIGFPPVMRLRIALQLCRRHQSSALGFAPMTNVPATKGAILVAEDETAIREPHRSPAGRRLRGDCGPRRRGRPRAPDGQEFDLVISDLRMVRAPTDSRCPTPHARSRTTDAGAADDPARATVEKTAIEALQRGAQDYLLKPLSFDDVLGARRSDHRGRSAAHDEGGLNHSRWRRATTCVKRSRVVREGAHPVGACEGQSRQESGG